MVREFFHKVERNGKPTFAKADALIADIAWAPHFFMCPLRQTEEAMLLASMLPAFENTPTT
ncbi:MAG TPA: hypothetical protein VMB80_03475 [Candidatus Acidoferrum sp.]|nr:hypothetical protein [Candidatus Acidoferrum sp.]